MSTPSRFAIVIIFLVVVLGGLFGWKIFQIMQLQAQFSQPQPPTPVAATQVRQLSWIPALSSVGSMRAVNGVEIANEVPGVVEEVLFESGQRVERGQVLLRLDAATDLAALNTLRADGQLAQSEFRRVSELLNQRAVSQAEYDAAKAHLDAASARINEQEAQVAKKILRAPFDGILGLRQADLGEYLPTGSPVVEINMLDPIYAEYTIAERELRNIAVGHRVELTVAAMPDQQFTGTVAAINSSVSPETRTVHVRATFANPDHQLQPGMFATIRTLQPQARDLTAVPRTAISFNTYGNFAFALVENEEGDLIAERRSVTTGDVRDGWIEVVEGLAPGELIVETGLLRLRAGERVVVEDAENQAEKPEEAGAPTSRNGDEGES